MCNYPQKSSKQRNEPYIPHNQPYKHTVNSRVTQKVTEGESNVDYTQCEG